MKTSILAGLLLLVSGCSTLTPEQTGMLPDGRKWSAQVTSGTLVKIPTPDGDLVIDRQGHPSPLSDAAKIAEAVVMNKVMDSD